MSISKSRGDEISEAETSLLDDVGPGSVDFKGQPSVRSKSGCWKSASFIIAIGVAESFAFYGIGLNAVSYLTGKLGQSTASAAAILNAWFGTASLLPIVGAFIADSFFGRFRMIVISSMLYVAGLGFLALSASLSSYNSSECKVDNTSCSPNRIHMIFFFVSFYLVALAHGGCSPCVQAFGADQFDEKDENEYAAKSSFFNWWYCFAVGGIMVPIFVLNYVQENVSWELGFGIPAMIMCFALIVFLIGSTTYRFRIDGDRRNPFLRIYQRFVNTVKGWQTRGVSIEEEDQQAVSREDAHAMFSEKAPDASTEDAKIDVEDTNSLLKLAPIWCTCLGYSIVYSQPSTFFTKQAATMDRHITSTLQIPAASIMQCFITIPIIISLPIYDRVFVPVARTFTKTPSGITMLQRIGTGLALSLTAIVFAAIIETKRLATAREYGMVDVPTAMIPMSIWWLAPQYVLSGIADVFALVGLQEFFYDQVSGELKSVGLAFYFSIIGVGNLISSFLVSLVQNATKGNGQGGWFSDNLNRARLDYFYWLLAGLSAFELLAFVYFARSYVYRRRIVTS